MNADQRRFKHEDVTKRIIAVFFDVYNELGYGFLESVYKEAMAIALQTAGLQVEKEIALEARFRGEVVGVFKADLLVNGCVMVELKGPRSDAWRSRMIARGAEQAPSRALSAFICVDLRLVVVSLAPYDGTS